MRLEPRIQEKVWYPSIEKKVLEIWESEKLYKFNVRSKKKKFIIDTPPPYPSGRPWHIGAVAQYSQIDMIARTARMLGYEVLFPIGIDRNGIPVELYVEKVYKVSMRFVPRKEFIELCSKALDELEAEMLSIMRRMGLSSDFKNYYRTDSPEYRALTQKTFIKLWNEGLIYEATRPNNYCWECGTTIADAEVEYEELPTRLVYMKFKVKETNEDLIIASTRPELLCSCRAVIVNPNDERYTHIHGLHAIVPIYLTEVPIIPHPTARPEFGTGAMMICSYGDYTDVQLFRELGLEEVVAIGEDGRMTEKAGRYAGLRVEDAREKIIEDMKREGFLVKVENIVHRTPICERSKTPIEIIPMKEYYLKQLYAVKDLDMLARKMKFHPEMHRQLLLDWINSLKIDYPISRRRYYATEIPIWYCKTCGTPLVPPPNKYYRPWCEPPPFERCEKCGSTEFIGEERTFDTWMDSSITPLFIISKYCGDAKSHKTLYPISIRPQGKDIVRTWLYYTLLRCYQLTGKEPFKQVWISGLGLDEKGEKMSKSKGNVIDPLPIIENYGADTFRLWNAQEASLGYDFRISEAKIASAMKFLTKLWNLSRFVSSFPIPRRAKLMPTDRWILAELSTLIRESLKHYKDFNFFYPARLVRDFVWNTFADHYVEMVKARAYGVGFTKSEQRAAWFTLHTVLKNVLLLLAPITPFITDVLWRRLYGKRSIHLESFPKAIWPIAYKKFTKPLIEFNSSVWAKKKNLGLSLKDPIECDIPRNLKIFEKDLIAMHNVKKCT